MLASLCPTWLMMTLVEGEDDNFYATEDRRVSLKIYASMDLNYEVIEAKSRPLRAHPESNRDHGLDKHELPSSPSPSP